MGKYLYMIILILKFNTLEIKTIDIEQYLHDLYPDHVIVRMFISSLYFDTFCIEVLLFESFPYE
jgi:hypothetical protein